MLWYGVIPSLCKRVTPKYSLCCQIAPLKGAIFLNSLDGILRTGWSVYTGWIFFIGDKTFCKILPSLSAAFSFTIIHLDKFHAAYIYE